MIFSAQELTFTEVAPWVLIGVLSNVVWLALTCAYYRRKLALRVVHAAKVHTHRIALFGHVWVYTTIGNEKFDLYAHMIFECTHGIEHQLGALLGHG